MKTKYPFESMLGQMYKYSIVFIVVFMGERIQNIMFTLMTQTNK